MTAPESAPPKRGFKRKTKAILSMLVLAPIALLALYTFAALTWNYSSGYRAGTLMKFSRKGFICKTWEGEVQQAVVPGVAPVIWQFTVRDDSVASKMASMLGSKVSLHYNQHLGVPTSCFGDTGFFVDSAIVTQKD
jgi:hypothetical protein